MLADRSVDPAERVDLTKRTRVLDQQPASGRRRRPGQFDRPRSNGPGPSSGSGGRADRAQSLGDGHGSPQQPSAQVVGPRSRDLRCRSPSNSEQQQRTGSDCRSADSGSRPARLTSTALPPAPSPADGPGRTCSRVSSLSCGTPPAVGIAAAQILDRLPAGRRGPRWPERSLSWASRTSTPRIAADQLARREIADGFDQPGPGDLEIGSEGVRLSDPDAERQRTGAAWVVARRGPASATVLNSSASRDNGSSCGRRWSDGC